MTKLKHIHLHIDDLHKLKKHKRLRVDKFLITVDDVEIPQVKVYGGRV